MRDRTFRNMHSVPSKSSTLPHQTAFFRKQRRHFATDELVRHGFLRERVEFVGIRHLPRTGQRAVVIAETLAHGIDLRLLSVESVSVEILLGADWRLGRHGVGDEDRVARPVDVGV